MEEESKSNEEEAKEFERLEENSNFLSFMKINKHENKVVKKIEIFDDSIQSIYPTAWFNDKQVATCRNCGNTGDSIVRKKCGVGNFYCFMCLLILCMWPCAPFTCCLVYDVEHFCGNCKEKLGSKTFI